MIFGPPNQEPRLEDLSLLLGHTCDPQTCMSEAHLRPSQLNLGPFKVTPTTLKPACQEATTTLFALWPNTKVLPKARRRKKGATQTVPRSCFSIVWCSHCQSAECNKRLSFQLRFRASLPYFFVIDRSPRGMMPQSMCLFFVMRIDSIPNFQAQQNLISGLFGRTRPCFSAPAQNKFSSEGGTLSGAFAGLSQ